MTRAAWLVAIGAALVSALATWLFSRRDGARDPDAADVARCEARIADLERELASARSTPPPVPASAPPGPTLAGVPPRIQGTPEAVTPAASTLLAMRDYLPRITIEGGTWRSEPESTVTLEEARRLLASSDSKERDTGLHALATTRDPAWVPLIREVINGSDRPENLNPVLTNLANLKDKQWSAKQLTGEPDTPIDGDIGTAWASKREDMGEVWLELDYAQAVRVDGVRIHETFNPGAVSKVLAKAGDGTWDVLWEGRDPSRESPAWFGPYLAGTSYRTTTIRVVLDTDRIPGWNEIDAVELTGDGFRQWAKDARASSSYSEP